MTNIELLEIWPINKKFLSFELFSKDRQVKHFFNEIPISDKGLGHRFLTQLMEKFCCDFTPGQLISRKFLRIFWSFIASHVWFFSTPAKFIERKQNAFNRESFHKGSHLPAQCWKKPVYTIYLFNLFYLH